MTVAVTNMLRGGQQFVINTSPQSAKELVAVWSGKADASVLITLGELTRIRTVAIDAIVVPDEGAL